MLKDPIVYRQLIGKLIYLNFTRLDICCVVHILSQYMERPAEAHLNKTFNVLKYLKSSLGPGVLFSTNSTMQLKICVDSDYDGYKDTRRSFTGFCAFLRDSMIS